MCVACATDEFTSLVHQCKHVLDHQERANFICGKHQHILTGRGRYSRTDCVDDSLTVCVMHGAHW